MITELNPIELVRSRPGFFLAGGLILILLTGLMVAFHPKKEAAASTKFYTNLDYEETASIKRQMPSVIRILPTTEPVRPKVITNIVVTPPVLKPLPALSIHVELPPDTNPPPLSVYAPVGRLIQCQLVNTVDSGANDTPIIALVTDDVWHVGKLVVPAGAEVHGKANVDTLRERIISSGTWAIVRHSGEELLIHGIALDRERNDSGGTWGITDGSPGLAGDVIRSQSTEEIKLFAATMLSGMASGLQQSQSTILGTQISGTAKNAALNGTSQVLNTYAQQILDTIKKQGVFVRVPAGKQFYLYVTQTIDLSKAKVGNARAASWFTENDGSTHRSTP